MKKLTQVSECLTPTTQPGIHTPQPHPPDNPSTDSGLAWLQTSNGLWRGICQMPVESANRVSSATITMWVPPEALQPRQDAAER